MIFQIKLVKGLKLKDQIWKLSTSQLPSGKYRNVRLKIRFTLKTVTISKTNRDGYKQFTFDFSSVIHRSMLSVQVRYARSMNIDSSFSLLQQETSCKIQRNLSLRKFAYLRTRPGDNWELVALKVWSFVNKENYLPAKRDRTTFAI